MSKNNFNVSSSAIKNILYFLSNNKYNDFTPLFLVSTLTFLTLHRSFRLQFFVLRGESGALIIDAKNDITAN